MKIQINKDMPLFEQVFDVMRVYMFLNDAADFSRTAMKRSRTYVSCLRWANKEPSKSAYGNLRDYLQQCLTETQDADQRECLMFYIQEIEKVVA